MNLSDYDSIMYSDCYYEPTCEMDLSLYLPDGDRIMTVLCYVMFGLGLLGNTTILWVLLRHIKLKTMTDVCLLNLALSDLILAASLPLWAINAHNLALCKLMTGVYQLGFYSGAMFVTLMCVDRYLAIIHTVAAMRARTLHYGIIASVIIWVISFIAAAPQVIFASLEMEPGDPTVRCQPLYPEDTERFWKLLRNVSENTVGLFVCLPIMIFCCVKILVMLNKCGNSKKGRAVKLIFGIVCVFVVCWVPYNVTVFLQTLQLFDLLNSCEATNNISAAMSYAEIIALSHCCVNPVIYAFVGEKFRKSLGKVLTRYPCCIPRRHSSECPATETPLR
ncbi:C-C chemokine receptor type 2-like isoform X2 [Acanthopagrus latus]|nr:C-C chemokine receptor type 2-like isoform X2 [Acanthopagrus latus]XP_036931603.1 C-C chemokine receptor type 2-like isoform X2 [Acanthopagrus latus]XP_036931604.1 C-C chemokine receptor type 2-like isoform X2 [Acanthopagrus latus]XP_036931605.1 C-C chemokine receptor type 2-like isoform X2 [Acanthopagrus latus]